MITVPEIYLFGLTFQLETLRDASESSVEVGVGLIDARLILHRLAFAELGAYPSREYAVPRSQEGCEENLKR